MDTIYGMLIHDIPDNAINHDIFHQRLIKVKKQTKTDHGTHFTPVYFLKL